jgi:uncharacterized membrane protein YhdT
MERAKGEAFREDPRFRQAGREARFSLLLAGLYFLWWYGFAFGLGGGDVASYRYVLGLPAWFFWSCVVGGPLFCLVLAVALPRVFREMPLDGTAPEPEEGSR